MRRYVCIHGHFYQPPRENPWLEAVEVQDSAHPYHDWNERIAAECYAPNGASRILSPDRRIAAIPNNYARISFNFGPTLLAWMERHAPGAYRAVIQADRDSRERFGGHGSAMAQAYNHMILPLANERDRQTQIAWGIRDFQQRFGRKPEGMWLPEAAVDLMTLDLLAQAGIRFTVLAPRQAARVRHKRGRTWRDVSGGRIDPSTAYWQRLPSGKTIALFFYDGPISQAVAFEKLLQSGERFAHRLLGAFDDSRGHDQIVHIATDGETYGHHQRHGDMALAYALKLIEESNLAELVNYGRFLELHPPQDEVQIHENSSWSCSHGLERWKSDCGCNSGGRGWRQTWRLPLRAALDWLRDRLAPLYERQTAQVLRDPWAARDRYIDVILDRSAESVDRFFAEHASRALPAEERTAALELLEMQRHALLMYTSCGWFFDELSGLETVQVIQYAGRAVQLAEELFAEPIEAGFLERLAEAPSNLPEHGDGRSIYEKWVRPGRVGLREVGAHHAIGSVFAELPERQEIFAYSVERLAHTVLKEGKASLVTGKVRITSKLTLESADLMYGVLHLGEHTVTGGVRPLAGDEAYEALSRELSEPFSRAEFTETLRALDRHFEGATYSLRSLFRDEQRRVLGAILAGTAADAAAAYRQLYENQGPMMVYLSELGVPAPRELRAAAEFVLEHDVREAFDTEPFAEARVAALIAEARRRGVKLDGGELALPVQRSLERMAERLLVAPLDVALLGQLESASRQAQDLGVEIDLWKVQNIFFNLARTHCPATAERAASGDAEAAAVLAAYGALGERLGVEVQSAPRP